nr:helix-turn-helix transcriptional regulator [Lachnospiraceae bacterium]
MDQEKIGAFIREIRKEKGLTQEQFAEKLGVSQRSVSRWETGKTMPDYSLLPGICEVLEINVAELLGAERIEGDSVPKSRVNDTARSLFALVNDKKRRRKLIGAVVSVVVTIICAAALYCHEFPFRVDSTADLERAIEDYHADRLYGTVSADELERRAVGRHLYVLYTDRDFPGSSGLACLEKGLFGTYRFLWYTESDDRWINRYIVTEGKKRYCITFCVNDYPELDSYGICRVKDGATDFTEENTMLLFRAAYDGAPFLTFTEIPDDAVLSPVVRYYRNDTEIDRDALPAILGERQVKGASNRSAFTAELWLLYVWEGIVILLGVMMTRYFLSDVVSGRKKKN